MSVCETGGDVSCFIVPPSVYDMPFIVVECFSLPLLPPLPLLPLLPF